jgi:hypothetical protein
MTFAATMDQPGIGWYFENRIDRDHDLVRAFLERQALSYSAMDWSPIISAKLEEIRRECSEPNWDGENARAIAAEVIFTTQSVINAINISIPRRIPAPDIVPENDGEICLSWDHVDGRSFSISLGAHGKMNFAGLLGKKGVRHGCQPIDVNDPRTLREDIEEMVRYIVILYT